MKKIIFLILLTLFLGTSCSKNEAVNYIDKENLTFSLTAEDLRLLLNHSFSKNGLDPMPDYKMMGNEETYAYVSSISDNLEIRTCTTKESGKNISFIQFSYRDTKEMSNEQIQKFEDYLKVTLSLLDPDFNDSNLMSNFKEYGKYNSDLLYYISDCYSMPDDSNSNKCIYFKTNLITPNELIVEAYDFDRELYRQWGAS